MSTTYTISTDTKIKRVLVDEIEVPATIPFKVVIVPTANPPTEEQVAQWLAYANTEGHFTFTFEAAEEGVNWEDGPGSDPHPWPINPYYIAIYTKEDPFDSTANGYGGEFKACVASSYQPDALPPGWTYERYSLMQGSLILHELTHALNCGDPHQIIGTDTAAFGQYLTYIRHPFASQFVASPQYPSDIDEMYTFMNLYYNWLIEIYHPDKFYTIESDGQDHTIHADHYPKPYITYTKSSGGSASYIGQYSVTWGQSYYRSFTINTGYKIKKIIINGRALRDLSSLRISGSTYYIDFYNVIRDQTLHVEFIEVSDFTISNNISLLDFFATFEIKTLVETLAFATSLFPATIFTEYLYYTQDEVPLNPGFDEYGKYIVAANVNERANIVISTHNELGDLTVLFPSFSENAHFYTINEITEFEEIILYESFPTHDD